MTATATAPTTTDIRNRAVGWLYVVGGLVGFVAASALTLEKIAKLTDPNYVPTCSINPVISCGSVMDSEQAQAFGFPNPLIGIAAFAVVATAEPLARLAAQIATNSNTPSGAARRR